VEKNVAEQDFDRATRGGLRELLGKVAGGKLEGNSLGDQAIEEKVG